MKNIHIESIENILKRKEEEIARLNEVLFIYKNNQYIRNEEKQAEERKSFIQASECKEIKNQNDKYEQHVGYQNNYNNNNNQNNISIKEADNFNNDHNNINKAVHSSHNNYESDYSYNYNQNRNHCYNNSNCENKNFMSESGNRFLINEEKEKELQKLISVYNMDKSELSVQDERNESSVTNKSNTKKVPGRIYSIKKAI